MNLARCKNVFNTQIISTFVNDDSGKKREEPTPAVMDPVIGLGTPKNAHLSFEVVMKYSQRLTYFAMEYWLPIVFKWQCGEGILSVLALEACSGLTTTISPLEPANRGKRLPFEVFEDEIWNEEALLFFDHEHYKVECGEGCRCLHPLKHLFVCFTDKEKVQFSVVHTDEAKALIHNLADRVQGVQVVRMMDPKDQVVSQLALNESSPEYMLYEDSEGACEFEGWVDLDVTRCKNIFDYDIISKYFNSNVQGLEYTFEHVGTQFHPETGLKEAKNVHLDFEVVFKRDVEGVYASPDFFDIPMFQWQCLRRGQLSVDEQNACKSLLASTSTTTSTTFFVEAARLRRQPFEENTDDIVNVAAAKYFAHEHYRVHCNGECLCKHPLKHLFVCFTKKSELSLAVEHTDAAKDEFPDLETRVQTTQVLRINDPLHRPVRQVPLNSLGTPEDILEEQDGFCEFKHWQLIDLSPCANLFDFQIIATYYNKADSELEYTYEHTGLRAHRSGLQETKNVRLDFEVVVKKTDDPYFFSPEFEKNTEWEWEFRDEHEV
mmetsp:Transcript_46516/g.99709  ORF Transcript_46516/g.99709 Transcript_46516/m.99709 type:complete len:547 (+) Transcript_46516:1-1641(+)